MGSVLRLESSVVAYHAQVAGGAHELAHGRDADPLADRHRVQHRPLGHLEVHAGVVRRGVQLGRGHGEVVQRPHAVPDDAAEPVGRGLRDGALPHVDRPPRGGLLLERLALPGDDVEGDVLGEEHLPEALLHRHHEVHGVLAGDEVVEELQQRVLPLAVHRGRAARLADADDLHGDAAEQPQDPGVGLCVELGLLQLVHCLHHDPHLALLADRHADAAPRDPVRAGVDPLAEAGVGPGVPDAHGLLRRERRRDEALAPQRRGGAPPGELLREGLRQLRLGVAVARPQDLPELVHDPDLRVVAPQQLPDLRREALERRHVVAEVDNPLHRTEDLRELVVELPVRVELAPQSTEAVAPDLLTEDAAALEETVHVLALGVGDVREEVDHGLGVLVHAGDQRLADHRVVDAGGPCDELLLRRRLELARALHLVVGAQVDARDLVLQHARLGLGPALLAPEQPRLHGQRRVLLHQLEAPLLQPSDFLLALCGLGAADAHEVLAHRLHLLRQLVALPPLLEQLGAGHPLYPLEVAALPHELVHGPAGLPQLALSHVQLLPRLLQLDRLLVDPPPQADQLRSARDVLFRIVHGVC
mmetsp:Transcript_52302/g.147229  ORF Transcript_52302/g.147229 Transcript_52302/m.147229 type:complete len:588 (+) Transcript_52302:286-2049(+)